MRNNSLTMNAACTGARMPRQTMKRFKALRIFAPIGTPAITTRQYPNSGSAFTPKGKTFSI
jgi:hypothetical protein